MDEDGTDWARKVHRGKQEVRQTDHMERTVEDGNTDDRSIMITIIISVGASSKRSDEL